MNPVVTITVAKNGYFVRYPKLKEVNDEVGEPKVYVVGDIAMPSRPMGLVEETFVTTDEQDILKLLQELKSYCSR